MSAHEQSRGPAVPPNGEKPRWLDYQGNVNRIVYGLYAVCVLLAGVDLIYHRHAILSFEAWPGFYAWYGFLVCAGFVLAAKAMRKVLMRDEDYYD